ncbi:hypothetical protein EBZ35_08710, partial [bacterium]|nr:hypothetical protein [bacterium]
GAILLYPRFAAVEPICHRRPINTASSFQYSQVSYTGFLNVTLPGMYKFQTAADDASLLYIDGIVVGGTQSGSIAGQSYTDASVVSQKLGAGLHAITYLSANLIGGGGQHLLYSGPDTIGNGTPNGFQSIDPSNLYYANAVPSADNNYNLAARIAVDYVVNPSVTDTISTIGNTLGSLFGAVVTGSLSMGAGSVLNIVNAGSSSLGVPYRMGALSMWLPFL